MTPQQIEALVAANAVALDLHLAAAHKPGVLAFMTLAAGMADQVMGLPLGVEDEPASVFTPVAPEGGAVVSAWQLDAATLAQRVRDGSLSARVAVEQCLARIEKTDTRVNAFTALLAERALKRAGQIDKHTRRAELSLAGVPFAVKNLFDISGLPTLAGSKIERDAPPGRARRAAGAPPRGGRRDPRRRAQHGRVRLRLHDRKHPLRADTQPTRPDAACPEARRAARPRRSPRARCR